METLPRDILPNIVLMDLIGTPPRFRYRLVGTAHIRGVGAERTGCYVDEIEGTEQTLMALNAVAERREPSYRRGPPRMARPTKDIMAVERVMLPLAADGENVDMILWTAVYTDILGEVF